MHQLNSANEWYRSNGMLVNPTTHQAMIIGNTNHVFFFPVHKSVALFGILWMTDSVLMNTSLTYISEHSLSHAQVKKQLHDPLERVFSTKGKSFIATNNFRTFWKNDKTSAWYTYFSCNVLCLAIDFLINKSTFVLEALFSGKLLVYQCAPTVHLCWLISSFIPSSTIS